MDRAQPTPLRDRKRRPTIDRPDRCRPTRRRSPTCCRGRLGGQCLLQTRSLVALAATSPGRRAARSDPKGHSRQAVVRKPHRRSHPRPSRAVPPDRPSPRPYRLARMASTPGWRPILVSSGLTPKPTCDYRRNVGLRQPNGRSEHGRAFGMHKRRATSVGDAVDVYSSIVRVVVVHIAGQPRRHGVFAGAVSRCHPRACEYDFSPNRAKKRPRLHARSAQTCSSDQPNNHHVPPNATHRRRASVPWTPQACPPTKQVTAETRQPALWRWPSYIAVSTARRCTDLRASIDSTSWTWRACNSRIHSSSCMRWREPYPYALHVDSCTIG